MIFQSSKLFPEFWMSPRLFSRPFTHMFLTSQVHPWYVDVALFNSLIAILFPLYGKDGRSSNWHAPIFPSFLRSEMAAIWHILVNGLCVETACITYGPGKWKAGVPFHPLFPKHGNLGIHMLWWQHRQMEEAWTPESPDGGELWPTCIGLRVSEKWACVTPSVWEFYHCSIATPGWLNLISTFLQKDTLSSLWADYEYSNSMAVSASII